MLTRRSLTYLLAASTIGCNSDGRVLLGRGIETTQPATAQSITPIPMGDATDIAKDSGGIDAAGTTSGLDAGMASTGDATAVRSSPGTSCQFELDSTVSVLRFNDVDMPWRDDQGVVTGQVEGNVSLVPGPLDDCGTALRFDDAAPAYLELDDSPLWQLENGSVDFWMRFPSALLSEPEEWHEHGILGRDASGNSQPGHLSVYFSTSGRLAARMQTPEEEVIRCLANPLGAERWQHIAVTFGAQGFELFHNGQPATGEDTLPLATGKEDLWCGDSPDFSAGLDGNNNPWSLGASSLGTPEGSIDQATRFTPGLELDNFRVTSASQDFHY